MKTHTKTGVEAKIKADDGSPTEEGFEKYQRLLDQRAWSFFRRYQFVEIDEWQAQAYLLYCEAVERYSPQPQLSFITYLQYYVDNYLRYYLKRKVIDMNRELPMEEGEDYEVSGSFSSELDFKELVDNLSEEAREIVNMLNTCGEELTMSKQWGRSSSPYLIACSLKKKLKSVGWSKGKVQNAFSELKCVVEEL